MDRDAYEAHLFAQFRAFATLTIDCARCGADAALANLYPTARGFICQRCLTGMPTAEWREVCGENDALAAVHARLRERTP